MHKIYTIKEVRRETPKSVTLILNGKINYNPGQFIMLWLPGMDEKPFAVSYQWFTQFGVTIEEKGKFTKYISDIKEGTKVGIRGPYGHGFSAEDSSIIVVGGLGMAPALSLIKNVKDSTIIQGARSKEFLLFLKDEDMLKMIEKNNNKIIYCTDDGSFGIHGFTTDVLKETISKKIKKVYTVGPEIMMVNVFKICEQHKINCEASLERYMRCGFGICGACTCGDQLVCKDGPVFSSEKLRLMKDFGKSAKLKSGRKVELKEYFEYRAK
ncbi:MAG: dihydroorotate dehydrogenase electron transfer subunit [Nanoarchaeota archaeon]